MAKSTKDSKRAGTTSTMLSALQAPELQAVAARIESGIAAISSSIEPVKKSKRFSRASKAIDYTSASVQAQVAVNVLESLAEPLLDYLNEVGKVEVPDLSKLKEIVSTCEQAMKTAQLGFGREALPQLGSDDAAGVIRLLNKTLSDLVSQVTELDGEDFMLSSLMTLQDTFEHALRQYTAKMNFFAHGNVTSKNLEPLLALQQELGEIKLSLSQGVLADAIKHARDQLKDFPGKVKALSDVYEVNETKQLAPQTQSNPAMVASLQVINPRQAGHESYQEVMALCDNLEKALVHKAKSVKKPEESSEQPKTLDSGVTSPNRPMPAPRPKRAPMPAPRPAASQEVAPEPLARDENLAPPVPARVESLRPGK